MSQKVKRKVDQYGCINLDGRRCYIGLKSGTDVYVQKNGTELAVTVVAQEFSTKIISPPVIKMGCDRNKFLSLLDKFGLLKKSDTREPIGSRHSGGKL